MADENKPEMPPLEAVAIALNLKDGEKRRVRQGEFGWPDCTVIREGDKIRVRRGYGILGETTRVYDISEDGKTLTGYNSGPVPLVGFSFHTPAEVIKVDNGRIKRHYGNPIFPSLRRSDEEVIIREDTAEKYNKRAGFLGRALQTPDEKVKLNPEENSARTRDSGIVGAIESFFFGPKRTVK